MDLIKSITKHTDFCGTALIEPNGDAHYDNGLIKNLSHRRYFKEVISGKRTLSDPLDSSISGSTRVVLGVPIYNSKHKVIGALGGSYDVTALSLSLRHIYMCIRDRMKFIRKRREVVRNHAPIVLWKGVKNSRHY